MYSFQCARRGPPSLPLTFRFTYQGVQHDQDYLSPAFHRSSAGGRQRSRARCNEERCHAQERYGQGWDEEGPDEKGCHGQGRYGQRRDEEVSHGPELARTNGRAQAGGVRPFFLLARQFADWEFVGECHGSSPITEMDVRLV